MYANLGQVRDTILDLRSLESQGADYNTRLRRIFHLAYTRLVGDVPKAVFVDHEHIVVLADALGEKTDSPNYTRRYLRRTTDPWVLEFVDATGARYPSGGVPAGAWGPDFTGTWDGAMHLELFESSDSTTYRRQSREWWYVDDQVTTRVYVSLDRPFTDISAGVNIDFRIHQPEIFMPSNVIRIHWPAATYDSTRQNIFDLNETNARTFGMPDYKGQTTGRPSAAFRTRAFQIPAPNRAPVIDTMDGVNWLGPANRGTFRFLYTRVWGKRPAEWRDSPGGNRDPLWESAPSPASDAFQHAGGYLNSAIRINVPEIDFMQDFGGIADLRYSRTGYRTRIYVARDAIVVGAPGSHPWVEHDGNFYLLAEIDGSLTNYVWFGSVNPDYFRRLAHSTGYQGWTLNPHQDDRYVLDFQVSRIPDILYDDQDTPMLREDALPTLVEIFLHYAALKDGNDQAGAAVHLAEYKNLIPSLRERYQNASGIVQPIPIAPFDLGYSEVLSDTMSIT